ncbi:MAG: ATP-dependent helicase [Lachnospiraceae bacterium]|nr:ATP-dependent helicase [Lachnospiraceae bacterium]
MPGNYELNVYQKKCSEHFKGPMLVVAGPGSGKTSVIINRVFNFINKYNVNPGEILAVTFSRAAANEMKKRLDELSGEDRGVCFATFHSFFFRLLKANGVCTKGNILEKEEEWLFLTRIIKELDIDTEDEDEIKSDFLNDYSLMKSSMLPLNKFKSGKTDKDLFAKLARNYERLKEINSKFDFSDMETETYALFLNNPKALESVRKKYKYILIDEFQDINKIQYEIIKLMAYPLNNIFAVGDDDQSIYMFRGSKPEFMLSFEKDLAGTEKVALEYNYRSTENIIKLSENIIKENKVRFAKSIKGTGIKGVKPVFFVSNDAMDEAFKISRAVLKLKKSGSPLNEIAVAYRNNIQGIAFVKAFKENGIAFRIKDGIKDIYSHFVAKDILAYMRLALNEADNAAFLSIINKPGRYIPKETLETLKTTKGAYMENMLALPTLSARQKENIESFKTDLFRIRNRKPYEAVKYIRNVCGYNDYIKEYSSFSRKDESLFMFIADEVLEEAKDKQSFEEFFDSIEGLRLSLSKSSDEEDAVTLTTLHGAKSLEFENVFITGLNEGCLPYEKREALKDIEEERRLFYVGVTRAKKRIFISWTLSGSGNKKIKPSRFIYELNTAYNLDKLLGKG